MVVQSPERVVTTTLDGISLREQLLELSGDTGSLLASASTGNRKSSISMYFWNCTLSSFTVVSHWEHFCESFTDAVAH